MFLGGLALFVIGSVACGFAGSAGALIAARVLQALGASMVSANTTAIVTATFPPSMRGRALGMIGAVVGLGLTVGPPVGGFLLEAWGWRWIFFVNLPVGALAIVLGLRLVPRDLPRRARRGRGPPGGRGAVRSRAVPRSGVRDRGAGAVPLVRRPLRLGLPRPLLPRARARPGARGRGTRARRRAAAAGVGLAAGGHAVRPHGDAAAGDHRAVDPGRGHAAHGRHRRRAGAARRVALVVGLFVVGLGQGLFQSPNASAAMGAAPTEKLGAAGGAIATLRNLGMLCGVGLAATIFERREAAYLAAGLAAGPATGAGMRDAMLVAAGVALLGVVAVSRGPRGRHIVLTILSPAARPVYRRCPDPDVPRGNRSPRAPRAPRRGPACNLPLPSTWAFGPAAARDWPGDCCGEASPRAGPVGGPVQHPPGVWGHVRRAGSPPFSTALRPITFGHAGPQGGDPPGFALGSRNAVAPRGDPARHSRSPPDRGLREPSMNESTDRIALLRALADESPGDATTLFLLGRELASAGRAAEAADRSPPRSSPTPITRPPTASWETRSRRRAAATKQPPSIAAAPSSPSGRTTCRRARR